ncbi:MAG: hypothetical protein L6R42_000526 [Xanthoria sp. 1 TBL-2021]|nr:MAG: hypothetical protein L6R42_000526 [Xanthoria sp. 1 TBL-2021]
MIPRLQHRAQARALRPYQRPRCPVTSQVPQDQTTISKTRSANQNQTRSSSSDKHTPQESTNSISLQIVHATEDGKRDNTVIWKHDGVRNEEGKVTDFQVHQDDFENKAFGLKNATSLTLFIESDPSDEPVKSGPTLTLVVDPKAANNGTKNGKDNHIGEKAGIAVGLGVLLIAVAGLVFWFLRRRRNNSAGYLAKRKGASRMTGDESGGGGGFTDEPTRGMELQDRQGHGRQDSWEAGWDSTSSQGGGGNTFRDEIDRQRRR